jgi:hypothetical protein
MNPEQCAERLGITVEELFERAYKRYCGLATSASGSSASDLAWYKKWKTVPIYVRRFVADEERRASAPVIDA